MKTTSSPGPLPAAQIKLKPPTFAILLPSQGRGVSQVPEMDRQNNDNYRGHLSHPLGWKMQSVSQETGEMLAL